MAWVSSGVKPLAMRFIRVAGLLPSRNPAITASVAAAGRPVIGGSAVAGPALAWQPVHEDAPGGAALVGAVLVGAVPVGAVLVGAVSVGAAPAPDGTSASAVATNAVAIQARAKVAGIRRASGLGV